MKKKKMIKPIMLLLTILLLCTPVSVLNATSLTLSNESFSFYVEEDMQLVFQYLIGNARTPAFKRGEKILVIFENYENSSVELPNDAPWWAETNTSSGWTTVYTPHHGDTKIVLYPREYIGTTKKTRVIWTWNLTFSNGSLLPEGYYRIVLPTNRCIYYQEFIISDTFGKLGWYIIDDILNSSVSMNKTFEVRIFLRTKNVTSELVDYLHTKIGDFSVSVINASEISPNYNYSLLYTKLQKYQILKAIELNVVDLITVIPEYTLSENNASNNDSSSNNQSKDNHIFDYSIYLGLTVLCVVLINIYIRQKRKLPRRQKKNACATGVILNL